MIDPKTRPLSDDEVRMPDGKIITKESMKAGLVKGVAEEFRNARNDGYRSGDWIKYAAEKVVDHLFEVDAYFDQMLEVQKQIEKNTRPSLADKILNRKSNEQKEKTS